MLAYSSIGQVGYLLMGIAALAVVKSDGSLSLELSHLVGNGVMLHIFAYSVTNMAAFLSLSAVYNITGRDDIAGLAGLARRAPVVAVVFTVSLFSLAGLPIFAGFASKFYLFTAVAAQGMLWLAGLAIFASLISLYYYLQLVRQMYIEPAEDTTPIFVPRLTTVLLGVLLLGIVFLGVYPAPLMEAIQNASDVILSSQGATQYANTGLSP